MATHPEVFTHEAVDEGVHEGVGHGDPVAGEEAHVVRVALAAATTGDVRFEVDEELEDLKRQPTQDEADHHSDHHVYHLYEGERERESLSR